MGARPRRAAFPRWVFLDHRGGIGGVIVGELLDGEVGEARESLAHERAAGAVVRLDVARVLAPHGLAVQRFLAGGAEPGQYSESLPWRVAQARKSAECAGAPEGAGCLGVTRGTAFEMDARAPAGTLRGGKRANPRRRRRPTLPGSPRRAALGSICRPCPAGRPATTRGPDRGGGIVARGRGLVARGRQGRARGCVSRHRPRLAPSARRRSLWRPRGEASQSTHLRYSTRGVTDWRASWHIATVREP